MVDRFPFEDQRHSADGPTAVTDSYDCAPGIDESGPEHWYQIDVAQPGLLVATVDDVGGDDVDVDLHLMSAADPQGVGCLERDNVGVQKVVDAGRYWLVADTWVAGDGQVLAGPYVLSVDFTPFGEGSCATRTEDLKMFWRSCAAGTTFTCTERVDPADGQTYRYLATPALGPVVKEAHLVTVDEDFGGSWPTSFTDQIERHYRISQAATGYAMNRREPWAPAGEGGSEFGQGSTGRPVPVVEEAWYINMYWRNRPARGTRMIVTNPANGRSVVAAAGFETGPGANTAIAGVAEEVHHHLQTGHRADLIVGFAMDQRLDFGPIVCR